MAGPVGMDSGPAARITRISRPSVRQTRAATEPSTNRDWRTIARWPAPKNLHDPTARSPGESRSAYEARSANTTNPLTRISRAGTREGGVHIVDPPPRGSDWNGRQAPRAADIAMTILEIWLTLTAPTPER